MFDLLQACSPCTDANAPVDTAPPAPAECLALMLDEIDYGMLLLADGYSVLHANHVARGELDAAHPLQLLGSQLRLRRAQDMAPLREALADAQQRGLRRLLAVGESAQRITLAVVPLAGEGLTLLVFGRRQVCPALSSHWFARSHGLTPAEARVLAGLCEGRAPSALAHEQGVALSTVRTQIGSIRAKTGADSIRALVRQVAVLPPLVNALRGATAALH